MKFYQGLLIALFSLTSIFVSAQTNKNTKKKESVQDKEINKNYSRPEIKKKRNTYLQQTATQRLGSGDLKAKTKGQKEGESLRKNSSSSNFKGIEKGLSRGEKDAAILKQSSQTGNSRGDIKYKTKGQKETEYISRSSGQRNFQGREKGLSRGEKDAAILKQSSQTGNSRGDIKYKTKGQKESEYISRSSGQRNFKGREKAPSTAKREAAKKGIKDYSGDQKYISRGQKEEEYINQTRGLRSYRGKEKYLSRGERDEIDLKNSNRAKHFRSATAINTSFLEKREENKKEMSKYSTGDLSLKVMAKRNNQIKTHEKKISEYQGNYLVEKGKKQRQLQKDMGTNSGDIALHDLEKREKQRRVKAKKMANFAGSIKTKDLEKLGNQIRKKEKDIANFQGNIKMGKRKKGAHPSAAYRGGKVANSYTQKERMRKKMIKKSQRKGDIEKPAHLNEKKRKAKFNSSESEIWW